MDGDDRGVGTGSNSGDGSSAAASPAPLPGRVYGQLSGMMFLQYGIWGAWLPILYPFLVGHRGFDLDQCGMILAGGAVGAIFGPFIAGQVADRFFNTEKYLALSHLVGAVLVWILAGVEGFEGFLGLSIVYGLIYAPTLALTNSLTFHHVPDRDRDFGKIRVWGTVGWIVAGLLMGHWLGLFYSPEGAEQISEWRSTLGLTGGDDAAVVKAAQDSGRADAFRLSAILGLVMAIYCWTLPKTPPAKGQGQSNATLEALGEVKRSPLLTLFLIAVPISIVHQFYFVHTSEFLSEIQRQGASVGPLNDWINTIFGVGGGSLMTIGQMTEIAVLATIPLFAKRVSRKSLLAAGIIAYVGRMALFAYTDSMISILFGVALHGFCFGCFIFVAFMVVDEETTSDVRASAQNLFNLVIVGIGIIVGSWFATSVVGEYAMVDGATDYTRLFSVPMWISIACLVALLVFYRGGKREATLRGAAA